MSFPVFDLHCDTVLALMGNDFSAPGRLRRNSFHIDLERASRLPGYAQCFACFTSTWDKIPGGLTIEDVLEREISVFLREVNDNQDLISVAYSAQDVENNLRAGKMSAIMTLEGTAGFGFDADLLESMYQVGFRIVSLGWNEKNPLAGSNVTGGCLTEQGAAFVKEAQRLGFIIDVSHISDEAFWNIIDITQAPIIATHSNSRSVWDVSRNLTDDMFRAICKTNGVAGFNQYSRFIGENSDIDTACDHILHFIELDPDAKHISLGGDLDGCSELPSGFEGVQDYPKFAQALLARGVTEEMVHRIFWDNALDVVRKCCK